MKCAIGHCGHCQLGPCSSARTAPSSRYAANRAAAGGAGAVTARTTAQARGLEVRLLRRLPALAARLRGRAARARRRDRHRLLPRGDAAATVAGPYDLSLVEGSITTPEDAERIQEVRASRGGWSRSAPARRPAGSRRCATSPTSRTSCRSSTPTPEYISTLETSTPDRAPTSRSTSSCSGCPDQQAPAARGDQRLPQRAQAGDRRPQRLHRVQARAATSA